MRATTPTHALTNEDELRLALEATLQLKLKAVQDELANLATMADIVKVDIADALARKPKPSETWSYEQVFLDLSTVEQDIDPGSIYRIALSCAGLVLSGQPLPAAPQAAARSHLEEQILRCSVATAKMALAGSDLTSFRLALLQADAFGWNQD